MQMNDMILVSVDDHVCEPPDMWNNHVSRHRREEVPPQGHRSAGHGQLEAEDKPGAKGALQIGIDALAEMQDMLYAQDRWAVLLTFQAMDAAGKDGAITARAGCAPKLRSTIAKGWSWPVPRQCVGISNAGARMSIGRREELHGALWATPMIH